MADQQPRPITSHLPARSVPSTASTVAVVLVQLADIQITSTTVRTPAGEFPLRGSQWQVSEHWLTERKTPTWAIVLAIVGFCLVFAFALLFLLVKETRFHGTVQVSVHNGPHHYVAHIPVTHQDQVRAISSQVNYVRSLAAL